MLVSKHVKTYYKQRLYILDRKQHTTTWKFVTITSGA